MEHTLFFHDLRSGIHLFFLLLLVDEMMIAMYQIDIIIDGDDIPT